MTAVELASAAHFWHLHIKYAGAETDLAEEQYQTQSARAD
ncbi:hypothetical protein SAMCCGM7_pC1403 (plasmid) [Sinorhizobium americanum CCGM7]|nr:hypothetical protein SAMCCGM7_pC1403 [Sinorhizobium americanum CCGM7]